MSEIARWDLWDGQMSQSVSGLWVRYAAHEFEVERLATALTEAHERCRALELAVEQADEMKAHAEASAAAEEAETDRVTAERDAAQAEVKRLLEEVNRLKAERDESDWKLGIRRKDSSDQFRTVLTLRAERNNAQAEVARLQTTLAEADGTIDGLRTELAEQDRKLETAQAEVERLKTLLTVERGEVATLRDRLWPVTRERDAAQAEVERLTQELDGRRATNQRVIAERDAARAEVARLKDHLFPWATYKQLKDAKEHVKEHVAKLTAERDAARAEVKRLQILLRCERNELSTLRDCLRVPMDHARQAEARRGSRLSRNEEEGRDE